MRHGDKLNNLGRTTAHRKALMANLTCQLIQHKRIITTLAKAKALRVYAEPLITRCKEDNMNNRRVVFSYLQDKEAIKELFGKISDKVADRPGGYTRIIKLERRAGDAGDSAMIELVDFNEIYGKETDKGAGAKKTRRGRRGGGAKKASDTQEAGTHDETVAETPTAEHEEHVADATEHQETATEHQETATEHQDAATEHQDTATEAPAEGEGTETQTL
jgi:large subunit ribosomal protein L17